MGDVTHLSVADALASIRNPMQRAQLLLAAAAYPEPGKGFERGEGERFMQALHEWVARRDIEFHGLPALRRHLGDNSFKPKPLKDWKATADKGQRRLNTAEACLVAHNWAAMRGESVSALFREHPDVWRERLNMRKAAVGANRNEDERIRDQRRLYQKFEPVLPLLYAARKAAIRLREAWPGTKPPIIDGWAPCFIGPMLPALLTNPERWVDRAIDEAEAWRLTQPDADLMLKVALDMAPEA